MKFWQVIIVACSLISNPIGAQDINAEITSMIKRSLPEATVGVILQDVATGKILYDYQGYKHFLPASTMKLFTAAAALKELGPDYRFETGLYANAAGDVALKFSGDPSLKIDSLQNLLTELKVAQIEQIKGDFWIDDSIFDGPMLGHGWTWDSTAWYHAAPVSAIIIDRNQFGLTLFPTPQINSSVTAKLDELNPTNKQRKLTTNVLGVSFQDSEDLCQIIVDVDNQNNVNLGGCWPVGSAPVHLSLAVANPRLQAQNLVLQTLSHLKIQLKGQVKFGKGPANLAKLAHHYSAPLSELLKAVLADSDNMYAESLAKTLGAKLFGHGSFKTGSLAIQQILAKFTGIDFTQAKVIDGSGASRYNLLTPLHLSRLLYTMYNEKPLDGYFREALAVAGTNGTLKNRFAAFDTLTNIQAKTGSLNGVSALSGYLTTRSKRELIVTIMINHAVAEGGHLKQFENDLCYLLVNNL